MVNLCKDFCGAWICAFYFCLLSLTCCRVISKCKLSIQAIYNFSFKKRKETKSLLCELSLLGMWIPLATRWGWFWKTLLRWSRVTLIAPLTRWEWISLVRNGESLPPLTPLAVSKRANLITMRLWFCLCRFNKCMSCYSQLVPIKAFVLKRQAMAGKMGQTFRELHILLQVFDWSDALAFTLFTWAYCFGSNSPIIRMMN